MPLDRYIRQTAIPEVGIDGQAKIAQASVLIVGAGGLGVPAITYLTGAGVGRLCIVDDDLIATHNLHRQVLYSEEDAGQYKALVAAKKMRALNSEIIIHAISERVVSSNINQLINDYDIILDAADNFTTTYLLSDLCKKNNQPLISASAAAFKGYVGVFCQDTPSYRALFPDVSGNNLSCAQNGVLGPVVGVLGLLQAQHAINIILNSQPKPHGKLLTIDLLSNNFSSFDFSGAEEPTAVQEFKIITQNEIQASDLIIDVRDLEESTQNPITELPAQQLHIPLKDLPQRQHEIPNTGQRLVLCCVSGRRASAAAELLSRHKLGNHKLSRHKHYDMAILPLN